MLLDIGEDGAQYAHDQLIGERGLAHQFIFDHKGKGTWAALVPEQTSPWRAAQLSSGGLSSASSTGSWIANRFVHCLDSGRCILVWHDIWAKTSDICARSTVKNFVCDESLYFWNSSQDSSDEIAATVQSTLSFRAIGVVSVNVAPPTQKSVAREYLQLLSRNAIEAYVWAFDRESLVVWRMLPE